MMCDAEVWYAMGFQIRSITRISIWPDETSNLFHPGGFSETNDFSGLMARLISYGYTLVYFISQYGTAVIEDIFYILYLFFICIYYCNRSTIGQLMAETTRFYYFSPNMFHYQITITACFQLWLNATCQCVCLCPWPTIVPLFYCTTLGSSRAHIYRFCLCDSLRYSQDHFLILRKEMIGSIVGFHFSSLDTPSVVACRFYLTNSVLLSLSSVSLDTKFS